jgi:hypothetical protein
MVILKFKLQSRIRMWVRSSTPTHEGFNRILFEQIIAGGANGVPAHNQPSLSSRSRLSGSPTNDQ